MYNVNNSGNQQFKALQRVLEKDNTAGLQKIYSVRDTILKRRWVAHVVMDCISGPLSHSLVITTKIGTKFSITVSIAKDILNVERTTTLTRMV